ncbi:acyl-CoA synthetase [Candidatus Magnetomorum sp. HK-1]|nr:acyl-CoA synthetase [Candidatus Magnetomorum sp. HK-1]
MLNLASTLEYSAKQNPAKTAIIFGDTRIPFGQLDAVANKVSNALKALGIEKGDRVALTCPNLPYFPMVYYGILKAGAVVVPLNVLLKSREIAYHLKDSGAKAFFCFQGTPDLPMAEEGYKGFNETDTCQHMCVMTATMTDPSPIDGLKTLGQLIADESPVFEMENTGPQDTAVILYTSGTTGFPKGAELSHSNLVLNSLNSKNILDLKHDDVHILVLPLFHSFGQTVQMNGGFAMSNTLVLIPRFTAEAVLSSMQNENVTVFAGVPTMYWQLLNYKNDDNKFDLKKIADTLRIGISGAASLPNEIIKGMEEVYNIPILEGYGLSETSPVATFNHLHMERKPGSVGTPIWGVDVKIVDKNDEELPAEEVGEIIIRGHNVMKGYYNKPEETKKAFNGTSWLHTGDLGKKDKDGYVYIVDRIKDMIIRGGFNIYPREIEEVLMTHPSISMASVIGVPHDTHGEEVKAYVVLETGANISEEELIAWSKTQMAAYKYPRIVEIRGTLPMTATGKILKKELKAEITGKH